MMATIKAPFNFVPLNDTPYIPRWYRAISQDIPFEDGLCGTLKIRITAESPIFICDRLPEDKTEVCEFCNVTDQAGNIHYLIPGTSVKGMLRSVMEILSFGKLTRVQNQSFGIRDLSNGADGRFYRAKVKVDNVHCGWLRHEDGQYLIRDCGLPWRISAEVLDRKFRMGLMDFIQNGAHFKSDNNKTAYKKYQMFLNHATDGELSDYFVPDHEISINAGGRKFFCFGSGGEYGTIVFTGQPGVREQKYNEKKRKMEWTGKFFEFVFPEQCVREKVVVPDNIFKAFESVHQNSKDYTDFRRKQLKEGEEIPVFFIYDEDGNVDTIGITYMYKFPAYNSIYNGIPISLLDDDSRDLCECIFGYTDKNDSLKGRMQFTSAMLQTAPSYDRDTTLALAKPHPSYYPLYLGKGQTWNSESVTIAGRKRYPVRHKDYILTNMGTDKMSRIIRPLDAGAVFEGTIRFNNLLPIELGALISAIDFCQHQDCFHSIGQGKPLGYGKVRISVTASNIKDLNGKQYSAETARNAFTAEMEQNFTGWSSSPQLNELFAMAKGIPSDKIPSFSYMTMSVKSEDNEFKKGLDAYSRGEQLGTFTQILSGHVPVAPLQSNVSADAKRVDIELQLALQQERKQKLQEHFDVAQAVFNDRQFLSARKLFEAFRKITSSFDAEVNSYLRAIEEKEREAREIEESARVAFTNKNFKEAKQLYEQAAAYTFDSYKAKINECILEIDKMKQISSDIATFLSGIKKLASISAFANHLKKRQALIPIAEDDVPYIIEKLKTGITNLSKKDQKSWYDRMKWKPIEDALHDKDMTDKIYEGIIS